MIWTAFAKTNHFISLVSQKYIFIFISLLLLVYFDSSFIDLSERFHIPSNKDFLIGIFLAFVSLFIFLNIVLIFTIKNAFLKNYNILEDKVKIIHNFIIIYLITISLLIMILFFEMASYNSYSIYLVYSLLIITHLTGIFFSIGGTIKFLNWFESNNDKLLLVYVISFVTFSILIVLSLVYTLTELRHFPETITPLDLKRTIHAISVNLSEIYPFYRISYFVTFCSIWVLSAFLLYDYFGRNNRLKYWVILSIPMIFFLVEFFPITLKLLISLYQLNPSFFLPFYTILSTVIAFIGATMVSITLWLLIRKIPNKAFRNYLILVAFGLLLTLISTHETPFPRFLFPPFGLITILFVGLAIYLLFMGFYSASLHISKDMSLVRNFANKIHQYGFFRNIAKSQLEQDIKGLITKALQSNEFDIKQKEKEYQPQHELEKEDIEKLFQIVKKELEDKRERNNVKK
jgi:hypothetical protein